MVRQLSDAPRAGMRILGLHLVVLRGPCPHPPGHGVHRLLGRAVAARVHEQYRRRARCDLPGLGSPDVLRRIHGGQRVWSGPMNRSIVAAAGAGLVAGVLGSVIGNAWLGNRQAPQTAAYVPTVPQESAPVQQAVAALALASASQRQERAPSRQPTAAQPLPPESEPEMRMFRDALAKHEQEPENPPWAARVKKGLSDDIEKLSADAKISRFELKC